MYDFTHAERRSLAAALFVLALGTVIRVVLEPEPPPVSTASRPAARLGSTSAAVDSAIAAAAEAERPLAPGERVDVNTADIGQLRRLPGVGPARARAIVEERGVGGPFRSPGDLARVPGVGPGLLERWRPHVNADPGALPAVAPSRRPKLDLNRAQPKDLEQITGIGPVLAARIAAERTRRGRFSSYEDLLSVPGIGPVVLETLRKEAIVR